MKGGIHIKILFPESSRSYFGSKSKTPKTLKHMYSQQVPGKLATMLMVVLCLTVLQNTATAQTISNSCSGANQITVGNCTNNQDANDNTVNDPSGTGCISGLSRDGWFFFVANSTRTAVFWNDNSNRNAAIAVYTGACGSLTLFGCVDNNGSGSDVRWIREPQRFCLCL